MANSRSLAVPRAVTGLNDWLKEKGISLWVALAFVASLLLSAASFYTTYTGMLSFMPRWLISFFITFGVQSLLLLTSWKIGFTVFEEKRFPYLMGLIFVVSFLVSIFFSFASLFDSIFDPSLQERTRITRIHSSVEGIISNLEERSKGRQRDAVVVLVNSQAYKNWRKNALMVAEKAGQAKAELQEIVQNRRLQQEKNATMLATSIEVNRAKIATGKTDIETLERELDSILKVSEDKQDDIAAARRNLESLEIKVIDAKTKMDQEDRGGDPTKSRPSGKGPIWKKLKALYDLVVVERNGAKEVLAKEEGALEALQDRRRTIEADIANLTGLKLKLEKEIETRERLLADDRVLQSETNTLASINFNAVRADLQEALDSFQARFEVDAFDHAAKVCDQLLVSMRELTKGELELAALSCDRGALNTMINPIGDARRDLEILRQQCIPGGSEAKVVSDMNFEQAVEYGRKCITVSGLPSDMINDHREEIARLIREEDPDASAFTKVSNALLGGEKLAYFALFLALVIDGLVLFCGFSGAAARSQQEDQALGSDRTISMTPRDAISRLYINHSIDQDDTPVVRKIKAILSSSVQLENPIQKGEFLYHNLINLEFIEDTGAAKLARLYLQDLAASSPSIAARAEDASKPLFVIHRHLLTVLGEHLEIICKAKEKSASAGGAEILGSSVPEIKSEGNPDTATPSNMARPAKPVNLRKSDEKKPRF